MKNSKSIYRDEGAQALVETVIAFPILIFFIVGIIEMTLVFVTQQTVNYSAFCAARTGIVYYKINAKTKKIEKFDESRMKISAAIANIPVSEKISSYAKKGTGFFQEKIDNAEKEVNAFVADKKNQAGGEWNKFVDGKKPVIPGADFSAVDAKSNKFIDEKLNKPAEETAKKDKTGFLAWFKPKIANIETEKTMNNIRGIGQDKVDRGADFVKGKGNELITGFKPDVSAVKSGINPVEKGLEWARIQGLSGYWEKFATAYVKSFVTIKKEPKSKYGFPQKFGDDLTVEVVYLYKPKFSVIGRILQFASLTLALPDTRSIYETILKDALHEITKPLEPVEDAYRDVMSAKAGIDATILEIEKVEQDISTIEGKLIDSKNEIENLRNRINANKEKFPESIRNEIENDYREVSRDIDNVRNSRNELLSQKESLKKYKFDIKNPSLTDKEIGAAYDTLKNDYDSIQNSANVIAGAKDRLYSNKKYIDESIADVEKTVKHIENNKAEIEQRIPDADKIRSRIITAKEKAKSEIPKIEESLYNFVDNNKWVSEKINKIENAQRRYIKKLERIFDYNKFPYVPIIGRCTLSVELPYP